MSGTSVFLNYAYDYPNGATPITASSGNVAAGTATATLSGVSGLTTYITGFSLTGSGATAASVVTLTVSNLSGATIHYTVTVPAGVTTAISPLIVTFPKPLPASATNTSIAVSVPSLGAGNTNTTVCAFGFRV